MAMFEVNLLTPQQFGAFVPWLVVHRGPLSVLVHPNTTEDEPVRGAKDTKNHTENAIWMGERVPIDTSVFRKPGKGPVKVG
jgi:aromatic ring-cleaving dioxygenase